MAALPLGRMFKIDAKSSHSATVIFLHGLGDTGQQWSMSLENLGLDHVKFLCPTAPPQPVTLSGGIQMPSWFDIRGLTLEAEEDEDGIQNAAKAIKSLVKAEIDAGIPPERIIIGGFSQGGATAIYTALTMDTNIGGVTLLSTWLPLHKHFPAAAKSNLITPIFQCHGKADNVVSFRWGSATAEKLGEINSKHSFKVYDNMGHHSSDAEMRDLKTFLNQAIPPK